MSPRKKHKDFWTLWVSELERGREKERGEERRWGAGRRKRRRRRRERRGEKRGEQIWGWNVFVSFPL